MNNYRMIALDMDGTLLTSNKRISPITARAIKRATQEGYIVVFSTGRTSCELSEYLPILDGSMRYASLLNGGVIYDLQEATTLSMRTITDELAQAVLIQAKAEDAMVQLLTPTSSVVTQRDVERMDEVGQDIYQELAYRVGTFVNDQQAYVRQHPGQVCKMNLHHTSPASRERSLKALEKLPLQITLGERTSLEITPVGVTKALGLSKLCEYLKISLDAVIAVGDSDNDLDALRTAGLAVAMGNSTPEILSLADVVVPDNDHDGIAELIDSLLNS